MWVRGNIPNGICIWNATVSVSNDNVPAIGSQYAWNYTIDGNTILELTSIPNQIIGTAGSISNAPGPGGTDTEFFKFTIANNSGSSQIVNYGYLTL